MAKKAASNRSPWTNVNESLPQEGELVFVRGTPCLPGQPNPTHDTMVRLAVFRADAWWRPQTLHGWLYQFDEADTGAKHPIHGVTHWTRLPSHVLRSINYTGLDD